MTAPQAVPQAVVMTDAPAVLRRASRRGARGPGHRVGPWDLFCAELLRSQRTFTWGVVAVTAVFTLQTIRLSHASIGQGAVLEVAWNGNALAWMHLYPAGFAVSLGLLVGVMAQWREERWRQGGAAWRAVAPRRVLVARLAVMGVSALACQVALIAPVVLDALLAGNGWGPWRNYLLFGLFMWMVVAGASAWGVVAYRVAGVAAVGAAPIMGLVWSLAGATQAERDDWWMWPWAWCARPPLSLLGVHGNSVLLEAGSPVWDYPLLPGFLLTAALGAAGAAIALLAGSGPGGRSRPRDLITGGPVAVGRAGSGGQSDRAGRGPEALVQAPRDARARRAGGLDARAKVGAAVANGSGLRSAVAGLAGVDAVVGARCGLPGRGAGGSCRVLPRCGPGAVGAGGPAPVRRGHGDHHLGFGGAGVAESASALRPRQASGLPDPAAGRLPRAGADRDLASGPLG